MDTDFQIEELNAAIKAGSRRNVATELVWREVLRAAIAPLCHARLFHLCQSV